ncbi:NAD-dependent epimerase/dehydratase family protein [Streptococcus marmotae]|uniref:NAD-dependent epimerase/dehydratase family protein n=1 Tax=Streptococcus marmotae TaxID=1825069 RepID=UPI0008319320|nr:NAD(P)-dependent oxidoreductase [Streptococcus marmotae]
MEGHGNPILQEDLDIIANAAIAVEEFKDSTVLVTGATGLVGVNLVRALACMNRIRQLNMTIYALVRNRQKAQMIYGELLQRTDIHLIEADLIADSFGQELSVVQFDHIIHAASVTTSKVMIEKPVETIMTSLVGTKRLLDLAHQVNAKNFVYISSMEVYGTFDGAETSMVTEEQMGYIDPLEVRSNYSQSKRMCENMCIAYHSQYGLNVKIARLSQTFGAGILSGENRVFAQFANSVLNKKDIVLHTKGLSEGNYCYLRDTIAAILVILVDGKAAQAYNVSNEETHTTIYDMAKMVCEEIANHEIRVVLDIPQSNIFGYAPDTKLKLKTDKLQALGWVPSVGLKEAYLRMIESIKWEQEQQV